MVLAVVFRRLVKLKQWQLRSHLFCYRVGSTLAHCGVKWRNSARALAEGHLPIGRPEVWASASLGLVVVVVVVVVVRN